MSDLPDGKDGVSSYRRLCFLTTIFSLILITWYGYQYLYWSTSQPFRYVRYPKFKTMPSEEDYIKSRLLEAESIWRQGVVLRHKAEIETPVPDSDPWTFISYRTIWDYFYADFNCPNLVERLGRVGDGGKWVCGVAQLRKRGNACVVYSYGISSDTTFEQDILNRTNCSLHAYDYTVKEERVKLPTMYPSRATFSKLGLGSMNSRTLRTLKSEMDKRGHEFIDILKVDVEGAEFLSLTNILKDFPQGLPFGQLLVELHLGTLPRTGLYKRFKKWWEDLEAAGLRAFHSEPNLYALSPKRTKPRFYEMSFLNVLVHHSVLHA